MRVFLVLLTGRDEADPLFLQIKQAGPSVYEAYCGESRHANHGERVVVGKRLIQSATDIFVGFTSVGGDDFYVRQFRDMKVIPRARTGRAAARGVRDRLRECPRACPRPYRRPDRDRRLHRQGRRFDEALGEFAAGYARPDRS